MRLTPSGMVGRPLAAASHLSLCADKLLQIHLSLLIWLSTLVCLHYNDWINSQWLRLYMLSMKAKTNRFVGCGRNSRRIPATSSRKLGWMGHVARYDTFREFFRQL